MPEGIEESRQDSLQAQELALQDEFVDEGHQPVVQDEGDSSVHDGPVGDIHGAALPLVDLDAEDPRRCDGADYQEKPRTLLLI